MQGSKHQVTGFCRSQCKPDRLQIAHLANQNNIRVFTRRRAQGFVEPQCVTVHFTLIDETLFAFMNEFNRVFNGQDMAIDGLVLMVDHGGKGR